MSRLMSVAERFWPKVARGEAAECWEWQACRSPQGYGWFKVGTRCVGAHRVVYELTHGQIPDGLVVRHRCDNPPCVNPDHLHLGTPQENNDDKMLRGRHPNSRMTECRQGHPLDAANTYLHPKSGKRSCRACNRVAQQRYHQRKKAA